MEESNGEYYCHLPPVDLKRKYVYAIVYARYPNQKDQLIVVGVLALSDRNKDQFVLQFFKDRDIKRFFEDEILEKFDLFSEDWLTQMSFTEFEGPYFIGTPFVIGASSAENICRAIHDRYEQTGYIVKDDYEKWF